MSKKEKKLTKDFVVHPDMKEARRQYALGNTDAFDQMVEGHRLCSKEGEPYWDTTADWQFSRTARRNTQKFRAKGGRPFPKKKKKRKK